MIILQNLFKKNPVRQTIEYCLKYIINVTQDDAYEVLRATDLNDLLKFVIDRLKRETISMF